ncbi:prepilin-type N-terminal cleavage/methylation domain-containing protein [Candidatus Peregrinibacteria bacterium]|nr:prepilin-type N-terminal cleavage/methylation domain-containing protein [Candidatus Peregrinibacteria bacterium]
MKSKFGILGMTPPQQVKRTRKDSQSAAKPRAAFTLIELLISTSIFAVVAVATKAMELITSARITANIIRHFITQAAMKNLGSSVMMAAATKKTARL